MARHDHAQIMDALPANVLACIARHLTSWDALQLAGTCRHLRQVGTSIRSAALQDTIVTPQVAFENGGAGASVLHLQLTSEHLGQLNTLLEAVQQTLELELHIYITITIDVPNAEFCEQLAELLDRHRVKTFLDVTLTSQMDDAIVAILPCCRFLSSLKVSVVSVPAPPVAALDTVLSACIGLSKLCLVAENEGWRMAEAVHNFVSSDAGKLLTSLSLRVTKSSDVVDALLPQLIDMHQEQAEDVEIEWLNRLVELDVGENIGVLSQTGYRYLPNLRRLRVQSEIVYTNQLRVMFQSLITDNCDFLIANDSLLICDGEVDSIDTLRSLVERNRVYWGNEWSDARCGVLLFGESEGEGNGASINTGYLAKTGLLMEAVSGIVIWSGLLARNYLFTQCHYSIRWAMFANRLTELVLVGTGVYMFNESLLALDVLLENNLLPRVRRIELRIIPPYDVKSCASPSKITDLLQLVANSFNIPRCSVPWAGPVIVVRGELDLGLGNMKRQDWYHALVQGGIKDVSRALVFEK
jgi:hypothetical protein